MGNTYYRYQCISASWTLDLSYEDTEVRIIVLNFFFFLPEAQSLMQESGDKLFLESCSAATRRISKDSWWSLNPPDICSTLGRPSGTSVPKIQIALQNLFRIVKHHNYFYSESITSYTCITQHFFISSPAL